MKCLIAGGGGFIGGHLMKRLQLDGHEIICADIKPISSWFQLSDKNKNLSLDLKDFKNCLQVCDGVDYIFNLACNMGGMGYIENNKAECMLSVLINTNLLRAGLQNKISKYYFSSSACVYNASKQNDTFIDGLKEEDAYPAMPEDGYGWEKLFSERMCRHFYEDFGLDVRIGRYHNIYGPEGTMMVVEKKRQQPYVEKSLMPNLKKKNIEVWGDGKQTRSFLYIDDCIEATMSVFDSDFTDVFNIGSEEQVSINQMIGKIEEIADYKVERNMIFQNLKA